MVRRQTHAVAMTIGLCCVGHRNSMHKKMAGETKIACLGNHIQTFC